MNRRSYLTINYIFAGIIICIFIYSAIYSPYGTSHPLKCVHEELLGSKCPTCGMSRGFSAIVRFKFSDAINLQPNSIAVFLFFILQLCMRMLSIVLVRKSTISLKIITNTDITLSLLLFLLTFKNLIVQTMYIFYKMLLTGNPG
jgi:hypothetical protein